jgi:hypothetical protein
VEIYIFLHLYYELAIPLYRPQIGLIIRFSYVSC